MRRISYKADHTLPVSLNVVGRRLPAYQCKTGNPLPVFLHKAGSREPALHEIRAKKKPAPLLENHFHLHPLSLLSGVRFRQLPPSLAISHPNGQDEAPRCPRRHS